MSKNEKKTKVAKSTCPKVQQSANRTAQKSKVQKSQSPTVQKSRKVPKSKSPKSRNIKVPKVQKPKSQRSKRPKVKTVPTSQVPKSINPKVQKSKVEKSTKSQSRSIEQSKHPEVEKSWSPKVQKSKGLEVPKSPKVPHPKGHTPRRVPESKNVFRKHVDVQIRSIPSIFLLLSLHPYMDIWEFPLPTNIFVVLLFYFISNKFPFRWVTSLFFSGWSV